MRVLRVLLALTLLGVGVVLVRASAGLPPAAAPGLPGPGSVPLGYGALLTAMAAVTLVREVRGANGAGGDEALAPPTGEGLRRLLMTVPLAAAYVAAMPFVGYSLATVVAVALMAYCLGARPVVALTASVGFSLFVYGIFQRLFGIPLP